jgi:RimJ/RimL family protein N-acetyltransferase
MQLDIPEFQTERLVLKAISLQDVDAYSKHFVDYNVIRFLSSVVPWPYPENGVEVFLKNIVLPNQGKDKWVWGIFLKENPEELIGCIDLWRKGKPENRGFWLGKKFWGKGIMTEANYPILDYAFKELGFEKLIFANAVSNIASRRIKEKTGCRLIGIEPASFVDPERTEHELWELTKEDWESIKVIAKKFNTLSVKKLIT